MYNLIFEGCDCVGKTNLINELKLLPIFKNYQIIKFNQPLNAIQAKFNYFSELKNLIQGGYIYDRYYFSEFIYAPIYRKYIPNYFEEIDNLIPNNTILFLIYADFSIIKQRFDFNYIKLKDIENILNLYFFYFLQSKIKKKYIINTSFNSIKENVIKINNIINNL